MSMRTFSQNLCHPSKRDIVLCRQTRSRHHDRREQANGAGGRAQTLHDTIRFGRWLCGGLVGISLSRIARTAKPDMLYGIIGFVAVAKRDPQL